MWISWEHIENNKNNPTLPLPQKNNIGPLDACYLTSLAVRIFFLAYLYSFPFLALDEWQEDEPWVYVHIFENPWERWGQVYYPYIKIYQKIPSVCEQQFLTHKFSTGSRVALP
jgi:hypothetical protein